MADDEEQPKGHFASEPSPGELLRAARLERKLDTKEVAATLNVDPWMLDALEHDEYGALGAPVFAKGHLRKYAAALGLNGDDLMIAYYQRDGTREAPPLVAESIIRVEAANGTRIAWLAPAAGVFALAIVALGVFLYLQPSGGAESARAATAVEVPEPTQATPDARSTTLRLPGASAQAAPTESPPAQTDATPPASTTTAATDEPPPPAPARTVPEPVATQAPEPEPAAATPAPVQPAPTRVARTPARPAATSAASAEPLTISLSFRGESWVEVYDGQRNKLLYGLGEEGTTRTLEGAAPLNVFLGKASDVDVSINGRPYAIPRVSRLGTARFDVDAPAQ